MSKTKLEKVLEHLLNNQEGQAKALLHQIFIEKARAIHEDLMTQEEDDDMMEIGGSGDQGEDFLNDVEEMQDDIADDDEQVEFEEIMSEEDEEMMNMEAEASPETSDDMDNMDNMDDMDDMDSMADQNSETTGLSGMEKGIDALTKALQELEAEFERLQDQGGQEDEVEGEDDLDADDTEVDVMDQPEGQEDQEEVDEDWDSLSEALSLDVIDENPLQSQKTPGEVGSGKFASDVGARAKSPVPASQKERMGAKPVDPTKGGYHSGYNRESAPSSATLKHTQGDNRRKKATDHMSQVSKEGASGAMLNKSGEGNKKSPLTRAPAK
tara:strand:- start:2586 stop:3560 length:975 start_codon:yes stop_codon:yes gene_type:complete